jgi:ribosomal protein S18 acetylase RimI-like enzyme
MIKFDYVAFDALNRHQVKQLFTENWNTDSVYSNGTNHKLDNLNGFIAMQDDEIVGILTYMVANQKLEVISVDSFMENYGVGSTLLSLAVEQARQQSCDKVWLTTTNDNIPAIRLYEKQQFARTRTHLYSVSKARETQPELPKFGYHGIPILHELVYERAV